MKNAKYLRYAFCVMVLLGMGQQASSVTLKDKLRIEEKLGMAEKQVVETKQLIKQAKKELEKAEKEKVQAERKKEQAIKKANKTENRVNEKRESYDKTLYFADSSRATKLRASAKKEWTRAMKANKNALRERKNAVLWYVHRDERARQKSKALAQAKEALERHIKEHGRAEKEYRQAQGEES